MVVSARAIKVISRIFCLGAIGLALSACASGPLPAGQIAWDGAGRDPNLPEVRQRMHDLAASTSTKAASEEEDHMLASLEPASAEGFAAQKKINADRDKRL